MTVRASLEGGIGRIVLDRPPLNILDRALLDRFRTELLHLAAQPGLRVLLLTAAGKHFSAGADVGEHLAPHFRDLIPEFVGTVAALDAFPLPVIAAVQGRCLGGGFELVQAADIVLAEEGARFAQPEIGLGVIPPAACVLLPERVGVGAVAELVFTGDPITAREAFEMGLVRRVAAADELEEAALAVASRIARHSASALRLAKRTLRRGSASRRSEAFAAATRTYVEDLMSTADATEGLTAFVEKRRPVWSDR